MHELVGRGATARPSASRPRSTATRMTGVAGHSRPLPAAQGHADQGPHPAAAGGESVGVRGQPPLYPDSTSSISTASFPATPRGNYTQQLPHALAERISSSKIDVNIDLHSGTDRPTVDYVYIWSDEGLSRAFGSKMLYRPTEGKPGHGLCGHHQDGHHRPPATCRSSVIELGGGIVDQTPYVKRDRGRHAQHAALPRGDRGRRDADRRSRWWCANWPASAPSTAAGSSRSSPANGESDQGRAAARPGRQPLRLRGDRGDSARRSRTAS